MTGFITKKTIVAHPILVYRLTGWRGLWVVLTAKRGLPFLTVLSLIGRI
jgi:hypothetical protein